MPVYTIFHRSLIPSNRREECAVGLTELHSKVTGAPHEAVKVMFIELDPDSFFSGGQRADNYVRIVGQIRQGRSEDQKSMILRGMYEVLCLVVKAGQIQTQIVEIDDTKTVMTDGAEPTFDLSSSVGIRKDSDYASADDIIIKTTEYTFKLASMASPADPVLASAMWTTQYASERHRVPEKEEKHGRLSAGCPSMDKALGGGLEYGSVGCINAEVDSGAQEICEAFLVRHLLSSPCATATVIDTALSFDVRKLHRALASAMDLQSDATQQALRVLDRLKIMKVFDFTGLTDSVSELRDALEGKAPTSTSSNPQEQAPRGTVDDSENEEEEMLDMPSPPSKPAYAQLGSNDNPLHPSSLLLIDNITQVVAPLMKNQHAQGQAVLASFMRSLGHLTKMHHLCTILINDAASNANIKQEAPSIFSSCVQRPALRQSFAHSIDTSLLLHRVPMSAAKAGTPNHQGHSVERVGRLVSVIEVLQDRNGESQERWAAFSLSDSGRPVEVS